MTDDLRTALSTLLQQELPALRVVDTAGAPVGQLGFEDVRRAVISTRANVPV